MKKYRILAMVGMMALATGSMLAQDYDDIYYDASKSKTVEIKSKSSKQPKTVAIYGNVPEKYKVAVESNYRVERDVDEYNRRGAYDPTTVVDYEVDINGDTIFYGDTIYEEAFANTRRIERFYNPDIVILSDDNDLVELYYDESPTINLIVGSDWGYGSSYGWSGGFFDSYYYPWYTGWYDPWYTGWYDPWYIGWYRPWGGWYTGFGYYYPHYWHWGWHYTPWWHTTWGWGGWYGHNHWDWNRPGGGNHWGHTSRPTYDGPRGNTIGGHRSGLATNRNTRTRTDYGTVNGRNGIAARSASGNRPSGVGATTSRGRGGYATSRSSGNMGSRSYSSGVTPSRTSTRSYGSYSSGSSYGGSRSSSSSSSSSGYRGSSSSHSSSYSSGSSHSSGSSGSYSSGSVSRSGGGSSGGASGGGGRRR